MFKYIDWSKEFSERLESVTGVSGELYKDIYEEDRKTAECFVYYDGISILPIKVCRDIYSPTRERIPITLLDDIIPNDTKLFNQNLSNFEDLIVIPNNRETCLVSLMGSFSEHRDYLRKTFYKHYNRIDRKLRVELVSGFYDLPDYLEKDFDDYWKEKTDNDCGLFRESKLYKSLLVLPKENLFSLVAYLDDYVIGVSYTILMDNCFYGVLSVRKLGKEFEKYGINNIFMFKRLELLCYPRNMNIDIGSSYNESSLFEYKRKIGPQKLIPVKGVRFK